MDEENEKKRIALAHSLAIKERRFILICGSGVSKDADVPTGWDVLLDTLKQLRYHKEGEKLDYSQKQMESYYNDNYKDLTYSEIISQLFPFIEDQRTYLQGFFEGKEPGLSHKLIAKWVKNGLIRFIITTNFDNLLEKALDEEENNYSIIANGDEALYSEPWPHIKFCRIYKIHGTIEKGRIKNTEKDLEYLDNGIEKDFLRIIDTHGVIVLGYSGQDKGVMNILKQRELKGLGFYWTIHSNANNQVEELVKQQNGSYIYVKSAYEFLNDILTKTIFAKEKIKTTFALGVEIRKVEEELDHLFRRQEILIMGEETRIDHLDLLTCQSRIATVSKQLSELKRQRDVIE